jgi:hypothetical protein
VFFDKFKKLKNRDNRRNRDQAAVVELTLGASKPVCPCTTTEMDMVMDMVSWTYEHGAWKHEMEHGMSMGWKLGA